MKAQILSKLKIRLRYLQKMQNTNNSEISNNYKIRSSEVKEIIKMISDHSIINLQNI
jgi:hypothetical protein